VAASVSKLHRRLSQHDVADLVFYWNEYESEIGIAAIDYDTTRTEGGEYVTDPLIDTIAVTARARRIRRKLEAVGPQHARVLFRMYGDQNRHAPHQEYGDLAPLVPYTRELESTKPDPQLVRLQAEVLLVKASEAYRSAPK
jgi:hypothetical protein